MSRAAAALNELLAATRSSRDIDLFHDTESALYASWQADRKLLESERFAVRVIHERPSFVEAEVSLGAEAVLLRWVRDSVYRFFPSIQHPELGLTLHPFDLATNETMHVRRGRRDTTKKLFEPCPRGRAFAPQRRRHARHPCSSRSKQRRSHGHRRADRSGCERV